MDSVESVSHSNAKKGDSAYKRTLTDSKSERPLPMFGSNPKNLPKLKVSKVTGRYPYRELVKIDLCGSIYYEDSQIPSQEFLGNINEIKEVLQKYKFPDFNENDPVTISLIVKDEANQPQYEVAIREIAMILNYHLIKRVRLLLMNIPNQLLTTEFSANILNIQHESLMEILDQGEITFKISKGLKCVRSSDLCEYINQLAKVRKEVFFEMCQYEY